MAPGITPPCPSRTVPVMVPVVICADAIDANPNTHAAARDLASHAVKAMNVASPAAVNRMMLRTDEPTFAGRILTRVSVSVKQKCRSLLTKSISEV